MRVFILLNNAPRSNPPLCHGLLPRYRGHFSTSVKEPALELLSVQLAASFPCISISKTFTHPCQPWDCVQPHKLSCPEHHRLCRQPLTLGTCDVPPGICSVSTGLGSHRALCVGDTSSPISHGPWEENLIPSRTSITCFDRSVKGSACFHQNI